MTTFETFVAEYLERGAELRLVPSRGSGGELLLSVPSRSATGSSVAFELRGNALRPRIRPAEATGGAGPGGDVRLRELALDFSLRFAEHGETAMFTLKRAELIEHYLQTGEVGEFPGELSSLIGRQISKIVGGTLDGEAAS